MKRLLNDIYEAVASEEKLLSVLIDPDKFEVNQTQEFLKKIPKSTTHIFVGGSTVENGQTEACIKALKMATSLPVILFPGDHSQITPAADGLLFLSLISGRNPEYLIDQQIQAVKQIRNSRLEIIPTGYILIDGGNVSAVEKVSKTSPMSQSLPEKIVHTALAGEYSGKKLIYLEAGSGAEFPVHPEIISSVKQALSIPIIVGGGIHSGEQLSAAYSAGADMVVVGTAFENGDFFTPGNDCLEFIQEKNR